MPSIRLVVVAALGLLTAACDGGGTYGEATVTGAAGSFGFGDELTAYHGTRHIVIVDRRMDCLDMAWVTRNYFGAEIPTSSEEFGAFQFTFDSDTPEPGTFSLEPGGAVKGWRLINESPPANGEGEIDAETAEEGFITIESASDEEVIGNFDVVFKDSNGTGSFTTVHCRNMQ